MASSTTRSKYTSLVSVGSSAAARVYGTSRSGWAASQGAGTGCCIIARTVSSLRS
ncbi:hypothetical protein [Streptomyces bacillaris]|uniref:hypothetical protein n=1 Tax=Streptomyces bacillaris TaxID=68179 RepID=UPI0034609997